MQCGPTKRGDIETIMNSEINHSNTSRRDILKWILIGILGAVGIGGYYYFSQYPWSFRIIGEVIIFGAMVLIAKWTRLGHRLELFFRDAYGELKKVVWPNRKETLQTTLVILGIVALFALAIWLIDAALVWVINYLTGQ